MMHVARAEWRKLTRPRMLLGAWGGLVGVAVLGTVLAFANAHPATLSGRGLSIERLEQEDGLVASLAVTGQLLGAACLVVFARSVANEYAHGTLRTLLVREPRRPVALAGKLAALALFVAASLLVAVVALTLTGTTFAAARGIQMDAWWTPGGVGGLALAALRLLWACLVWGCIGATLGLAFRSGVLATGIGIAYLALQEHMVQGLWPEGARWLPGLVLEAFARGGTKDVTLGTAGLLSLGYAAVLLAVSWAVFQRRDVHA